MALIPFPVGRFAGLRLDLEPDEVGANQAIDALNVDVDKTGAVRVRDGFNNFTSSAGGERYGALARFDSQLIAADESDIIALNSSGAVVATNADLVGPVGTSFVRFGSTTAPYMYVTESFSAGSPANNRVHRWDGSAWTTPGGFAITTRYPHLLTLQPTDNRLVGAYSLSDGFARVHFSDAGAAETWTSTNFVDLHPGDGEVLSALVTWRDLVIAFKETKFFVFYGNSTDAAGNPIFNYRTIHSGVGLSDSGHFQQRHVAVAPHCVYFLTRTGIYRTEGNYPTLISDAVGPIFQGGAPSFFQGGELNQAQIQKAALHWHNERLYIAYPSGSATANDKMLVYDSRDETWTLWNIPAAAMTTYPNSDSEEELVFSYASGSNHIGRVSASFTDDDGTAIASRYRSGFFGVGGQPSQEAVIRESVLDGIGTPSFSVSKDFGDVPTTGGGAKAAVTLGVSPAYGNGRHRVAQKGRRFSYQIEATSGVWRVNSITHHVRGIRPPGVKST